MTGVAGNTYSLVAKLPVAFEFDFATFDEADAEFWVVDFAIEKYKANAGKGTGATDPGPLSLLSTMVDATLKWAPSGMLDKQVGAQDLDVTLTIHCWKTSNDPFHGVSLLGKDHTNYCPIQDRISPVKRGFKLLPTLGPTSSGIVKQLMSGIGGKVSGITAALAGNSDVR